MTKRIVRSLFVLGSLVLLGAFPVPAVAEQLGPSKPLAKNVIIMICDGWGFNQLQAASYYEYGKDARQIFNRFPFNWAMTTYSTGGWGYSPALAWSDFNYVKTHYTDSAAAATAMATGVKTYDAAIGVDTGFHPLVNILQVAEQLGKSTGVVTSVEISHATPAGFVAHNVDRDDYVGIAKEMIDTSAVDVIMGAGNPWYTNDGTLRASPSTSNYRYLGGQITWDALVAGSAGGDADADGIPDHWQLIQDRNQFQALASGPTPKRVIGIAKVYETLQQRRSGDAKADPYVIPFTSTVPTLEEMTKAALNVLDNNPKGLVLMVEGGAVDWAGHSNQSGRMIEEAISFERAVEAVMDWVQKNSNWGETLLIVTGDHETGYLTGPGSDPEWMPIVNNGQGVLPGMEWHSGSHTNSLMVLSAKGDAARLFRTYVEGQDPVRGPYIDNISVAKVMLQTLYPQ